MGDLQALNQKEVVRRYGPEQRRHGREATKCDFPEEKV
jgi:hypothetical protein